MAFDRTGALANAQKMVLKGKLKNAIKEYEKVISDNPDNETALNALGNLYARMNKVPEACKHYKQLGENFLKKGFSVKALAIFKRVVKLDPASIENNLRLAEIQKEQGFLNEAKVQYTAVADRCAEEGMKDKAIEILKKLTEIDPNDLSHRMKLATFYKEKNNIDDAVKEFRTIGDTMVARSKTKEAIKVYKKALEIVPDNPEILGALGAAYTDNNESEKAIKLFEELIKKDAKVASVWSLLGQSYLQLKNSEKAEEAFTKASELDPNHPENGLNLGRLFLNQGNYDKSFPEFNKVCNFYEKEGKKDRAVSVLKEFIDSYSSNPDAFARLASLYESMGQSVQASTAYDGMAQACIALEEFDRAIEILEKIVTINPENEQYKEKLKFVKSRKAGDSAPEAPTAEIAGGGVIKSSPTKQISVEAAMATDEDNIQEYLTEADVFLKYGLVAKAIEQLQTCKSKYPQNIEARTKLLAVYKEQGNRSKAVEECLDLSRLFRALGDEDAASELIENAKEIDPKHPQLRQAVEADAKKAAEPKVEEVSNAEDEEEFEIEVEEEIEELEEDDDDDELDASEMFDTMALEEDNLKTTPLEKKDGKNAQAPDLEEGLEEVDFYLSQGFKDDAQNLLDKLTQHYGDDERVKEKVAALGSAKGTAKEVAEDVEEDIEIEEDEPTPKPKKVKKKAAKPVAKKKKKAAPKPKPEPVVEEEEEEIEEEVEIEASDEEDVPSHETDVADVMAELDNIDEEGDSEGEDFFDLASEIESEVFGGDEDDSEEEVAEDDEAGLDDLFQEFKKGVEDQIDSEDYETHYNLGIAYKEMGLIDEAIGEFQTASKGGKKGRLMDCCSMLGICFMDKGMPKLSAKWYRKALAIEGISDEEETGLKYDLAGALEATGDLDGAYEYFLEIYGTDSKYRDVGKKVKKLQRAAKSG